MIDILALLQCLTPVLTATRRRQLNRIILALLAMTGRVTMLGIARWSGAGGSYRTIQRFYHTTVDWGQVHWLLFKAYLFQPGATYILAGDEVVVTKAGRETHGLDRFFSSLAGKPVPGLAFFALALVNVGTRTAHPLRIGQVVRPETPPPSVVIESAPSAPKAKRGRPKGSKNRNKADVPLSAYLRFILTLLQAVKQLIGTTIQVTYVVLDGAFGNNAALQMVRRCDYHLLSKLAVNTALFFRYDGPYRRRGARKKYGEKVKYAHLPACYRRQHTTEKGICTEIYQFNALHKLFAQTLNVVIIVKTNGATGACAHAILFSSDLDQPYAQLIDYYTLRFQIEFNFRDAKQHWGLEDFMNTKETPVTNAANLAFFMVNLAAILRQRWQPRHPLFSVLDLKAHFRGLKYVAETLKLLPQQPEPFVIQHISAQLARLGAINLP
ncbi:MAG: transposase [Caldilinea sp. CFX5]|nr:transposase [Caldilinea sp. CFX5]